MIDDDVVHALLQHPRHHRDGKSSVKSEKLRKNFISLCDPNLHESKAILKKR
jgi:hypothetical protein